MASAGVPLVSGASHLTPAKAGMLAFLLSEVAFFGTLIMTYVAYLEETRASQPGPAEVFSLPLVIAATVCLLSSSFTIHLADRAIRRGQRERFLIWWGLTIALGAQAVGVLVAGFAAQERVFRLSGLAMFGICVMKLFFYDLRNLETLSRILSFIVLGLVLMGASWLYMRFKDKIQKYL